MKAKLVVIFVPAIIGFALWIDLRTAKVKEADFKHVLIDASQPLPSAIFDVNFHYGSRLSTLRPTAARCTLPSGDIYFQVKKLPKENGGNNQRSYQIYATCLESDVISHADLLWDVMVAQNKMAHHLIVSDFTCALEVTVHLLHVIPISRKVEFSSEQQQDSGTATRKLQTEEQEEKPQKKGSSLVVRSFHPDALKLDYRLTLPESVYKITSAVTVLLPSLVVNAQPQDKSVMDELVIRMDAVNSTFGNNISDANVASFGLECHSALETNAACPWYRPIMDLLFWRDTTSNTRTSLDVTVDGGGSFLEILLGRQHFFVVHQYVQEQVSLHGGHRLLLNGSDDPLPSLSKAQADCLQINDDSREFDLSLCWIFKLSEGFLAASSLTFYDYGVEGVLDTHWQDDSAAETVEINTRAALDMDKTNDSEGRRLNLKGNMRFKYDEDDIQLNISMTNDGSWRPLTAFGTSRGTLVDDVLNMTMPKAYVNFEGENIMTDATGSLFFDFVEWSFSSSLMDPDLEIAMKSEFKQDEETVKGSSTGRYKGDDLWTSSWLGRYGSSNENGADLFIELNEKVSNLAINVEGEFQEDKSELRGNSIGRYGDNELWVASLLGRMDRSDDDGNALVIDLREAVSDLQIAAKAGVHSTKDDYNSYYDFLSLVVEYFTVVKSSKSYVNMKIDFVMDFFDDDNVDKGVLRLYLHDESRMDYVANVTTSWDANSTWISHDEQYHVFYGNVEKVFISSWSGPDVYIDISDGTFYTDNGVGSVLLFSNPGAKLQFETITSYRWDETDELFTMQFEKLLIGWDEETVSDLQGHAFVNVDESKAQVFLEDKTIANLVAKFATRWYSEDSDWGGNLDEAFVTVDSETRIDTSGSFEFANPSDGDTMGALEIKSSQVAALQIGMGMDFTLSEEDEAFRVDLDKIEMGWEDDTIIDARGKAYLNIGSSEAQVFLEDTARVDFSTKLSTRWFSGDFGWGGFMDDAFLRVGSKTSLDSAGSLEIFDRSDGTIVGVLGMKSDGSAELRMGMGMNFTWSEEDETLTMVMDHMQMIWRGTRYIDTGLPSTTEDDSKKMKPEKPPGKPKKPPGKPKKPPGKPERPVPPGTQIMLLFDNIEITLNSVGKLNKKAIAAFEKALAAWYDLVYLDIRARRLEQADFIDFSTFVAFQSQSVTDSGNTITYDQGVTFVPTSETVETEAAAAAKELLENPFEDSSLLMEYVGLLQQIDGENFAQLQASDVEKPIVPSGKVQSLSPTPDIVEEDKDSSFSDNIGKIVGVVLGGLVFLTLLLFLFYKYLRRQNNKTPRYTQEGPEDGNGREGPSGLKDNAFENEYPGMVGVPVTGANNEYYSNEDVTGANNEYYSNEDEVLRNRIDAKLF